jgi:hypothetical protein
MTALVDVALALFLAGGFDVEVDQLLAVDDRDPQFFRLRRVEQHAFHEFSNQTQARFFQDGAGKASVHRCLFRRRLLTCTSNEVEPEGIAFGCQ